MLEDPTGYGRMIIENGGLAAIREEKDASAAERAIAFCNGGVMALAGAGVTPRTALAVAATYTVGFRAAYGRVDLPEVMTPGEGADATVEELALAASLHAPLRARPPTT